jgi:hypothetical protein
MHGFKLVLIACALASETAQKGDIAADYRIFFVNELDFTILDVRFIQKREHFVIEAPTVRSRVVRPFVYHHRSIWIPFAASGPSGWLEVSHAWWQDET